MPPLATPPSSLSSLGMFRIWLVLGIVVLNVIMGLAGLQSLLASRERSLEQVRASTGNFANLLKDNINHSARGIDLALGSIADSLERMQLNRHWRDKDIEDLLETHNHRHSEVVAFRLTDAKGDVRWGKGVDRNKPANFADRDYFHQHQTEPGGRLLVSEPIFARVQKTWAVVLTRSYRTPDGNFAGVITAAVPVEHFTQLLSHLDLGPRGSAVIRHDNFALVTRYPPIEGPAGATGSKNATPEFRAVFESGVTSTSYFTPQAPDGYARTIAFRRMEQLPLVALVGMAPEDYLAPWKAELRNTMLLLAAFLLVSTGAAWLIWRYWQRHLRDSAALRAREAELLESERRLALATESGGIGVWDLDLINNRLIWDERMYRIYGVAPERFGGAYEAWQAGVHPDDLAEASQAVATSIENRKPFQAEFRIVRPDGETRNLLANASFVLDDAGKAVRMIGINIDISERKQAEAALIEAKLAAEDANLAKSRFLATMSHEIRTPLNGVLGMAQLLLDHDITAEERQEYARIILHSGKTLLALLNDILDLSKVEAGRMQLHDAPFSTAMALEEIGALFAETARAKGLALQTHWRGNAQQRYRGDIQRLLQMLSNLTNNAIKFTAHGSVRIEGREIAHDNAGTILEFTVADTGIGVAPEHLPQLFKPFSQLDSSSTRQYGGTGLGLSIVRCLAELMGGEVGVDSVPDQGSRFWFRVRVGQLETGEDTRQAARAEVTTGLPERFSGRVLVVEDNPTNLIVIGTLLRRLGMAVVEATDGRQCVDMLMGGEVVNLVLMDIQMPVMDGYAATARIRAWEREQGSTPLPIIALTADAFAEDRQRCLTAGMDDHLGKPVDVQRVAAILKRYCRPASADF